MRIRVIGLRVISVVMTRSMGGIPIAKRKTLDLQHGALGPASEIAIAKPPSPHATVTGAEGEVGGGNIRDGRVLYKHNFRGPLPLCIFKHLCNLLQPFFREDTCLFC